MFYAALDISLRSVAVCIIDQDGKVCFERSGALRRAGCALLPRGVWPADPSGRV